VRRARIVASGFRLRCHLSCDCSQTRVSGGIFLLRGEDELVAMVETAYDSEDVLQALLARFPDLLGGDQLAGDAPRRWLLVGREAALPSEEDGGGRWSVDHLFLDQDAIPTLVEVKRSSDTRIRREVIGQMLDYAANAVVYWPIDTLRAVLSVAASWRDASRTPSLPPSWRRAPTPRLSGSKRAPTSRQAVCVSCSLRMRFRASFAA
jgi:hypothetical protein